VRVLITNAEERAVLAACRSLHAAGYQVSAAAFRTPAASHWSRACSGRLRMTDPVKDCGRFVEELERELRRNRYGILLPGSDRALLAISGSSGRLEDLVRVGLPEHALVRRALDRENVTAAARDAGFPAVESLACADHTEALAGAQSLGFPLMLKTAQTAIDGGQAVARSFASVWVASLKALSQALAERPAPFLLQRALQGDVLSVGGVMAQHRLLGVAVSRYLRTWRPEAGNVTFSETIPPPPGLCEHVRRLLVQLGWQGVFELELIQTVSGELVPIDFNPRVYGSMTLAAAAGAPVAVVWCDWLMGRQPAAVSARPGVRYRWEDGELAHLGLQLRRRHYSQALAVMRPYRHVVHAQAQLADPLPLIARSLQLLGRRLSA
jgi:predicted ATP-grasp superfamily ATP-dependent carboligase